MNSLKFRHLFLVAKFTFIEVFRSRLMVLIPILGIVLLTTSFIVSSFSYGAPGRVAIDVGLGLMSITNLILAIFIGATLISREVEAKTIYMIVSKPISRSSFLFGKIIGFFSILFVNAFTLVLISQLIFKSFNNTFDVLVWWVGIFSLMESVIVLLIAILCSLISNVTLTVIYTIMIWVLGSVMAETKKLFLVKNNLYLEKTTDFFSILLPDFSKFNLKDYVLYQQTIEFGYIAKVSLYFFLYSLFLCCVCGFIFKRKDFN